jgi:hypothetical protein
MFTKLSDLNKAIIFTVLVLFIGLIAGLIVNLLNVASEFLGAGLYAFTPQWLPSSCFRMNNAIRGPISAVAFVCFVIAAMTAPL